MSSITSDEDADGVDTFRLFIEEIGAEIDERTFRLMKRLCRLRLSQREIELMRDPAQLICALVDAAVISENNLKFLSKMLRTAKKTKLVKRLKEYQNRYGDREEKKRKPRNSDTDVHFNTRYIDIPVPIGLRKATIKDQTLYFALLNSYQYTMDEIARCDSGRLKKIRLRKRTLHDLEVGIMRLQISSVILVIRCWCLKGLQTFMAGLMSGNLEWILTDDVITEKMKAMADYIGVTLRISVNVDPIHLDMAERYLKDNLSQCNYTIVSSVHVSHGG